MEEWRRPPETDMAGQPASFAGNIPEFYERHLRQTFFEPYARDLAARLDPAAGPFLELACGTGVLTRQILARLGAGASLTATDLHPPMLAEAQQRVAPLFAPVPTRVLEAAS